MENSIEEDIKIIENFINWLTIDFEYDSGNEIKAIEHILSDYKKVLKENEYMHNELDKQQTTINKYAKENEEYSKQLDLDYVDKNYIPIQKVKDEKEKLDKKYNELVDKVYKDPLKALTDFQRVVGGQAILNALLKEGET